MTAKPLSRQYSDLRGAAEMTDILNKEIKLSASVLSFIFIAFSLMFFFPGYPVLCGVFFVTLGIFQSFQSSRETNDITFSVLLPVSKADIVKGKYLFVCLIELASAVLMAAVTLVRMTLLSDAAAYRNNALMNANFFALGAAFLIFGLFNLIFVAGFFKTAYKFAKPFVTYIIIVFVLIGICEALHHIPGLEALNSFGFDCILLQLILLAAGMVLYSLITFISLRIAVWRFEKIDL